MQLELANQGAGRLHQQPARSSEPHRSRLEGIGSSHSAGPYVVFLSSKIGTAKDELRVEKIGIEVLCRVFFEARLLGVSDRKKWNLMQGSLCKSKRAKREETYSSLRTV